MIYIFFKNYQYNNVPIKVQIGKRKHIRMRSFEIILRQFNIKNRDEGKDKTRDDSIPEDFNILNH